MKNEKFNVYYAGLASLFSSKDDIRFYLNGIYIEPCENDEGAYIVATDGHRLVAYHDRGATITEPLILSTDNKGFFQTAKKKDYAGVYGSFVRDDEGFITLSIPEGDSYRLKTIEGKFPDWKRVIHRSRFDNEKCSNFVGLNSKYLKDIYPIIPKTNGRKMHGLVAVLGSDPTKPVMFYDEIGEHEFFALIMPIKTGSAIEVPEWISRLKS